MEEEKEYEKDTMEKIKDKTEEILNTYTNRDLDTSDLEILGKLVDIHKDISNEEYWKGKERYMMRYGNYGNYGNYGRRAGYDSYGNYGEYGRGGYGDGYGDGYGRRGYDAKYRGYDHIDRMGDHYGRYEEGREQYNRGNYGAKDDTLKSLEYMLQSAEDFFKMLKQEANSPEEMQLFQEYAQRIANM